MNVREARLDELDALAAACAEQPLLKRYGTTAERLLKHLHGALAAQQLLVVEKEGAVRGFAWFLTSGTFAAGGYLKLIALTPGAEGGGLGAALLDEVERRVATHSRFLFLLVSHWNDGARRFYATRGYREVGLLPKFVRDDTDEVICMKQVAQ
jgi:ribosomal protein S18 acetylase RimI-like enzyme